MLCEKYQFYLRPTQIKHLAARPCVTRFPYSLTNTRTLLSYRLLGNKGDLVPQGKFPSVGGSPRRVLEKRNQQPPVLFDCMLPSRADARVSSAWRYSSVRARDKEETPEQDVAAQVEEVAAADLAVDTEPAPGSLPITGSQVLGRSR